MNRTTMGIATLVLALGSTVAQAQAPAQIPVQGYLTDAEGAALTDDQTIRFGVFDVEAGGVPLFEETQTVSLNEGYFTAYIGDIGTLDLATFRDNGITYLELIIDGEALSPRMQLATAAYAAYAEFAGSVDFSGVNNLPAGLVDGDDDTLFGAGAGLSLAGTTFAIDEGYVQRRVSSPCPAGQVIQGIGADGSVSCSELPTAGAGLVATGSTWSVDTAAIQARVSGSCAAGTAMRTINADGTVDCLAVGTGDLTGITTGTSSGLTGGCASGTCTLSLDPTDFNGANPIDVEAQASTMVGAGSTTTLLTLVTGSSTYGGELGAMAIGEYQEIAPSGSISARVGFSTSSTGEPSFDRVSFSTNGETAYAMANTSVSPGSQTIYLRAQCIGSGGACILQNFRALSFFIPD